MRPSLTAVNKTIWFHDFVRGKEIQAFPPARVQFLGREIGADVA